jgi:hypothetical protein
LQQARGICSKKTKNKNAKAAKAATDNYFPIINPFA